MTEIQTRIEMHLVVEEQLSQTKESKLMTKEKK